MTDGNAADALLAGENRLVGHAGKSEWAEREFIGAVSDVTPAKQAEDLIREDEGEFRRIVEAIPALIVVLSPDGSPLYANQMALEYTGLTSEDVQAKDSRQRLVRRVRSPLARFSPRRRRDAGRCRMAARPFGD